MGAASKNVKNADIEAPEPQKVMFLMTDEKKTCGGSGLVFWVHRKSEGRGWGEGGASIVVGGAARKREGGGSRFDSRLARFRENPLKTRYLGPRRAREPQKVVFLRTDDKKTCGGVGACIWGA